MNIGNIGNAYGAYNYKNKVQNNNGKSFGSTMVNVTEMASPNLTLHISHEGDADKSVGSWADGRTGQSITVYEPADFDQAKPVYKMKIWDKDDNLVEEKEIDLSNIDPKNSDSYEMYAYSTYLSKTGQCANAEHSFMMAHAYKEDEQFSKYGTYDLNTKENWIDIVKGFLQQQYESGNLEGYMKHKGFYDFLNV